jgi:hypothetical protein
MSGAPPRPAVETVRFAGAAAGPWRIAAIVTVTGEGLGPAPFLAIGASAPPDASWTLAGVGSHLRYTTSSEKSRLVKGAVPLGRSFADRAALIPIRKTEDWWMLAQDERRAIYARSRHMEIGMDYVPAVARKLFHSRDLGEAFDFLTWFEFSHADSMAFDELLERLRMSEEWRHVDREVEIRLERV